MVAIYFILSNHRRGRDCSSLLQDPKLPRLTLNIRKPLINWQEVLAYEMLSLSLVLNRNRVVKALALSVDSMKRLSGAKLRPDARFLNADTEYESFLFLQPSSAR
jgi:hypothetical protein